MRRHYFSVQLQLALDEMEGDVERPEKVAGRLAVSALCPSFSLRV